MNGPLTTPNTIQFNIPGSGVRTITPTAALPAVSRPLILDGTTQPGFAGAPVVDARGNGQYGIDIEDRAANNTVGGTTPEARNVISGNSESGVVIQGQGSGDNQVLGSYIGTTATGAAALGNLDRGVRITNASGNQTGVTVPGADNVIAGSGQGGVYLEQTGANGNAIQGNFIGTNAAGPAAFGNQDGVRLGVGAHDKSAWPWTAEPRWPHLADPRLPRGRRRSLDR